MRKALIGVILAATVLTPVAAQAQERGERRAARAERVQQRQAVRSEARSEARAERQVQRVERRADQVEQRVERRADRVDQRVERRQAREEFRPPVRIERQQPVQVVQRDRRERAERRGSAYPDAWQGNPNDSRRRHYEELERRNQYRYGNGDQRDEIRREWREERQEDWRDDDDREYRRDWREERRDWSGRDGRRDWRRDWNRDWRYDNRYDWSSWRYRNRNLYRGSRYYSPYRNHSYSRFGIGYFLEPMFFSQRYWINDPFYYRLPPAPPGTRWIRYYNDVLLVDTWSGQVVDVVYDFFW